MADVGCDLWHTPLPFQSSIVLVEASFLAKDVTMLLQLAISFINISVSSEILLNLQTKCNNYFRKQKHL
ncbi:MAG TPA: hypothetical protein DDW28_08125 [Prevotella sp.]|nr:hypothetical protein [Candidatus Segatella violae]